jgi:hypothetical protein
MLQLVSPIRRIAVLASACGLATVGALALIGTARADGAETPLSCSKATLKGTYAFTVISWSIPADGPATPVARAGFDTFDGDGTGTGVLTINNNGVVVADHETETATYSINTDCTGTVVFSHAAIPGSFVHFNIYVSPSGNQFRVVATDPGNVDALTETRVAR